MKSRKDVQAGLHGPNGRPPPRAILPRHSRDQVASSSLGITLASLEQGKGVQGVEVPAGPCDPQDEGGGHHKEGGHGGKEGRIVALAGLQWVKGAMLE